MSQIRFKTQNSYIHYPNEYGSRQKGGPTKEKKVFENGSFYLTKTILLGKPLTN